MTGRPWPPFVRTSLLLLLLLPLLLVDLLLTTSVRTPSARAAAPTPAATTPAATTPAPASTVPVASGPGAQPEPGSRVAVLVDRLEPAAPQLTDTVEVTGTVFNRAAEQFDSAEISLHLGRPVVGRTALGRLRAEPTAQPLASRPIRLGTGRLDPGARVPFSLTAPAATLLTHGSGVYPLQVTVVGRTTEGLRDLGTANSFVPFVPNSTAGAPAPMPVAWVLPLTDSPRLAASGGVTDDVVAAQLSEGGRLDDVLTAATNLPAATVVVDPALLRAVSILSSGRYPVGLTTVEGTRPADGNARVWLSRLAGAVGPAGHLDLVPTAFADADLETLIHDDRTDLARQVLARGTSAVRDVLGTGGDARLVVPAAGRLDRAGADFATTDGAAAALLDPAGVSGSGTIRAGGDGNGLTPIVPDQQLRGLLLAGPTAEPSPRLAEQSVLAELAQAYLTPTTAGAPIVLAPGANWTPSAGWAAHLATLTASQPWMRPIGLTDLLTASARGNTAQLHYTDADRAAELPASLIPPVTNTLAAVNGFAEALPRRQTVTRSVTDTALTALSAWFRSDPAGSNARQTSADAGLDALRGAVRVVASREVTLTSRDGRIPVTLENNLADTVDVTLRLTSLDRSRVQSDTSVSRVIPPGQKVQVEVAVRATSAGTSPIRLELLTPTGRPIGAPLQVLVRSTAAGVVAKGVTITALAILVLAVLGRGIRGLLRRRRRPPRPPRGGSADAVPSASAVST